MQNKSSQSKPTKSMSKEFWEEIFLEAITKGDDVNAMKALIEAGANVNELVRLNLLSRTPLHIAAKYNAPKIARLFLEMGANIHAVDDEKRTSLHVAAIYGSTDVATLLIARGAYVHAMDNYNKTPLEIAMEGVNQIKKLIDKATPFSLTHESN